MVRVLRQDAERLMARIPEQHVFWIHDEGVLRDMRELGDALNNMSDETYAYHANELKKDFANWVRDIIGDEKLARDLDKVRNRGEAARAVVRRVAFLSSKL